MLFIASSKYKEEVGKYEDLIKNCINENDFYIKKLAMQILKNITTSNNCIENINIIVS